MAIETTSKNYIHLALEVSIHIGLLALLTIACLWVLRPFIPLVTWGIIITIAVYPAYQKLQSLLGGRGTLAAVLGTLLFLAVLIIPVALLTETMIEGVQNLTAHLKDGSLAIPLHPRASRPGPSSGRL